ncbi:hypothetical protein MPL1_10517 [Methylophaga lonarensis MPL]|uniref:Nitrate/nitrite sensing protein domain-containing protein n=1 Tax=Methylophaga lonarensis MPL TaxID=1286106 RepID=M7NYT0_9GAMM|nr:nitrate- and nitrite sensing domain-containing protein [Methylophaga lonarensis]EMR12361.1 hypothetical protein MPL1_10517 [Methylophaga lonarensis MPL]
MSSYLSVMVLIVLFAAVMARMSVLRSQAIEKMQRGLDLLIFIRQVMDSSQKHRGTANAYVQGNDRLRSQLMSIQSGLDRALADGSVEALKNFPQWQSFSDHWPRLKQHVLDKDLKPFHLIRQHNLMIESQLSLFDDVARAHDFHKLMLDNKTRVSELCLDTLHAAETIGQARAIGSGLCVRGKAEGADAMMLDFLRRTLKSHTDELLRELSMINNDKLNQTLRTEAQKIQSLMQVLLSTIEQKILIDGAIQTDSQHYFEIASQPIEALLRLFGLIIDYTRNHYAELY